MDPYGKDLHETHCELMTSHQMASISNAQGLFDEAEGRAEEALYLVKSLSGAESRGAASCYHLMAACW